MNGAAAEAGPPAPPYAVLSAVALPALAVAMALAVAPPPGPPKPLPPPSPPVAELWPMTLPMPETTVVAVPAPPAPPTSDWPLKPPLPPLAIVEASNDLAATLFTVREDDAPPPAPGSQHRN